MNAMPARAADASAFRHIEPTVLRDMLHRQLHSVSDPLSSLFRMTCVEQLYDAEIDGMALFFARAVTTHCSQIRRGDYVYLVTGEVGKVIAFWTDTPAAHEMIAQVEVFSPLDGYQLFRTDVPQVKFMSVDAILDGVKGAT